MMCARLQARHGIRWLTTVQYIRNTFNAAKDSISINGMDSREMEAELAKAQEGEEFEPFDTKLAQRLQTLTAKIDHETLQLANLRKNAPVETAQRFQQSFEKQEETQEARLAKAEQERLEVAKDTKMEVGEVERMEEVQGSWQKGSEKVAALKTGMGSTVARIEKARKAVEVVGEK
jgi:kinetochor protein Mis14/NSL1